MERARKGGTELELDLADDLPALHADGPKLKQILLNILDNAIKFTGARGKVTLRAGCQMDSGYVFQIIDTGIDHRHEEQLGRGEPPGVFGNAKNDGVVILDVWR